MNTQAQTAAATNGLPGNSTGQPLVTDNQPGQSQAASTGAIQSFQGLEAEAALLECILLDEKAAFPLLEKAGVTARHLHHGEYKKLFKLALALRQAGHPVSAQTVLGEARQRGIDPLVLAAVESHINHPRHVRVEELPFHLTRLKELQIRRELYLIGQKTQRIATDNSAPVHSLLVEAYDFFGQIVHQSDPEPLTICSAEEIARANIREDDNLLGDRLLAKGQSLTITGAGGVGKSRLLLQLAACVITGREFLDLPTHGENSTWLILQAENSPRRLQQDLHGLRQWLGEDDWQRVSQRLFCHTISHTSDAFVQIDDPLGLARIRAWIDKLQPDVVCFDPLNCFVSGDLNSDRDMRQFCTEATRLVQSGNTDRAIVVLHHARTGKMGASQATGYDRSNFARNSKVLYNWTRGQVNIAPRTPDNNQSLVVACGKCSNGREFQTIGITLDPQTMTYQLDTKFNVAEWEETLQAPTRNADNTLEALIEICATPCSRLEARKQLEERGFSKSTIYKHISHAIADGILVLKGGQLSLPEE